MVGRWRYLLLSGAPYMRSTISPSRAIINPSRSYYKLSVLGHRGGGGGGSYSLLIVRRFTIGRGPHPVFKMRGEGWGQRAGVQPLISSQDPGICSFQVGGIPPPPPPPKKKYYIIKRSPSCVIEPLKTGNGNMPLFP